MGSSNSQIVTSLEAYRDTSVEYWRCSGLTVKLLEMFFVARVGREEVFF